MHRDLKPENIMMEVTTQNIFTKLIDFGLSHLSKPEERMFGVCGTVKYIAPEVIKKTYNH